MVSETIFVLASGTIREEANRTTLPAELERTGIVEPGEPVVWAIDKEEEEMILTQDHAWFTDDNRFVVVRDSMVNKQLVTTVPRRLITEGGMFDYGDPVMFVASEEELTNGVCRVVTADEMQDRFDPAVVDKLTSA